MSRLAIALEGFDSLSPSLNTSLDLAVSDRIESWLRDEVVPVVAELVGNRGFKSATCWSVKHLDRGADTPERRLIEQVDRLLVSMAAELASVLDANEQSADQPLISPNNEVSKSDQATIRLIANRPWFDLAHSGDFFYPDRTLLLDPPDPSHVEEFRQQELRIPLGDYVARLMFARVDYWKNILDRVWNNLYNAILHDRDDAHHIKEQLFERRIELDRVVSDLDQACNQEQPFRIREACTTLTLVYAAYASQPSLDWLGCPPSWWQTFAPMIRSCIRRDGVISIAEPDSAGNLRVVDKQKASLCDPDVVRQIAAAMVDVRALYDAPDDPDLMIEWSVDRARLVLVDRSPREVYWDTVQIAGDVWDTHAVEWNLLWTLAEHAGRLVDQGMLLNPENHELRSRRYRLGKLLKKSLDLDTRIENVRGQGYRLDLTADDILLLRDNGRGELEVIGRSRVTLD